MPQSGSDSIAARSPSIARMSFKVPVTLESESRVSGTQYLVVPAKAGTQGKRLNFATLDSRLRGNDEKERQFRTIEIRLL